MSYNAILFKFAHTLNRFGAESGARLPATTPELVFTDQKKCEI
jgi:hypothetical protein